MKEILMPKLGFDMEDGTISSWLVSIGDHVTEGDVIAEIETAKATVMVQAFFGGILTNIVAKPGDIVPVGQVIAILDGIEQESTALHSEILVEGKVTQEESNQKHEEIEAPASIENTAKKLISPVAKRIILEMKLDPSKINGTGPDGIITKEDVLSFSDTLKETGSNTNNILANNGSNFQLAPLSKHKILVGKRMLQSTTTIPQFSVTCNVEMTRAVQIRQRQKDSHGKFVYSINDFIIKAASVALTKVPILNSMIEGDHLKIFKNIDIGVATAQPEGLITVKIRNADTKNLHDISNEMVDLLNRASLGILKPEELSNSTFTISNLGMYGIDNFTAIINPPEAAILSIGSIQPWSVYIGEQWITKPIMKATLVVDHRIGDGIDAARFLSSFREYLENITLDIEVENDDSA